MALLPFTFLFLSLRPAILSAAVVSSSTVAGVPADRGRGDPGSGRRRSMTARRLYSSTRVLEGSDLDDGGPSSSLTFYKGNVVEDDVVASPSGVHKGGAPQRVYGCVVNFSMFHFMHLDVSLVRKTCCSRFWMMFYFLSSFFTRIYRCFN